MSATLRRLTLLRAEAAERVPQPVLSVRPLPLTADSVGRVSGRVRALAWALEEHGELTEVECFHGAGDASEPGVALLDRRFPIFVTVLEDEVFLLVDCELLAGPVRERLRAVRQYVEYFASHGYDRLYDLDTGTRHAVAEVLPDLPSRLAASSTSGIMAYLRWDFRISFVLVVPIMILVSRLIPRPTPEPWVLTLTRSLALGAVMSFMQYRHMRAMLAGRIAAVKHLLVAETPDDRPLVFHPRPPSNGDLAGAIFIAALTVAASAFEMSRIIVAAFTLILIGGVAWTYWLSLSHVVFDAEGVEGRGLTGRVRLRYADIESARDATFGDMLRVSGHGRTFWIPQRLRDYGTAVAHLEERIERARRE